MKSRRQICSAGVVSKIYFSPKFMYIYISRHKVSGSSDIRCFVLGLPLILWKSPSELLESDETSNAATEPDLMSPWPNRSTAELESVPRSTMIRSSILAKLPQERWHTTISRQILASMPLTRRQLPNVLQLHVRSFTSCFMRWRKTLGATHLGSKDPDIPTSRLFRLTNESFAIVTSLKPFCYDARRSKRAIVFSAGQIVSDCTVMLNGHDTKDSCVASSTIAHDIRFLLLLQLTFVMVNLSPQGQAEQS